MPHFWEIFENKIQVLWNYFPSLEVQMRLMELFVVLPIKESEECNIKEALNSGKEGNCVYCAQSLCRHIERLAENE